MRRANFQNAVTPTIKDVAQRARVSTATVSRVLTGSGQVSKALEERVAVAVKELGYRPNRVARNLRVRVANTVGLIVSDIQNPFFTSIMRGIQDTLLADNFVLLVSNSDEEIDQERVHLETFQAEGVSGIIFTPAGGDCSQYQHMIDSGVNLVAIDRIPHNLDIDVVMVDNLEGARTAVTHLIHQGHERIGLVGGPPDISTAYDRQKGYEAAFRTAGLRLDPELIKVGDMRQLGGYQAMCGLLDLLAPPTAVFAINNLMTLGALQAIRERRLAIPRDIAVVGFDDMPWSSSLQPSLTAVAQPTYELGVTAAHLLLDRIKDPYLLPQYVVLKTTLVVRASTTGKG